MTCLQLGKTHTMMGPNGDGPDRGVIPRCLQGLFTSPPDSGLRCPLSFVQIYCERVLDLLSGLPTPLSIRESEDDGVFVDGVQKKHVHSVEVPCIYQCINLSIDRRRSVCIGSTSAMPTAPWPPPT